MPPYQEKKYPISTYRLIIIQVFNNVNWRIIRVLNTDSFRVQSCMLGSRESPS